MFAVYYDFSNFVAGTLRHINIYIILRGLYLYVYFHFCFNISVLYVDVDFFDRMLRVCGFCNVFATDDFFCQSYAF